MHVGSKLNATFKIYWKGKSGILADFPAILVRSVVIPIINCGRLLTDDDVIDGGVRGRSRGTAAGPVVETIVMSLLLVFGRCLVGGS